ncbi:MAG: glycosyltransferase family 2 protein, partial [Candidatus Omnitrophota bacterium]
SAEQIEDKVKNKLQVLLIYEGYDFAVKGQDQRMALVHSLSKYPFTEVYLGDGPVYRLKNEWAGKSYEDILTAGQGLADANAERKAFFEVIYNTLGSIGPFVKSVNNSPKRIIKGKTVGQSAALEYARGDIWLFFDSNASVRFEEASKIPAALAEFAIHPDLALNLFGEYINTKNYSWIAECLAFGEEVWTQTMQRALSMYGASGFYGHSAFVRADAMKAAGGLLSFYASEDLLLAIRLWQKGMRTSHSEYILFGKGRERGYVASHTPLGRWSEGSAELILGRQIQRALRSNKLHMGQKMMLIFALSFYTKKPLVVAINYLYLFSIIFIGVSPFVGYTLALIFGVVGILISQSINTTGLLYLIENNGVVKGLVEFIHLFPRLFALFVAEIVVYAQRMINGVKGASGFAMSLRGLDLEFLAWRGKDSVWGTDPQNDNAPASNWPIVVTMSLTVLFFGLLFASSPALIWGGIIGLAITPFVVFLAWKDMFLGPNALGVRIQIILSIPMIAFVFAGIWFWGGIGASAFLALSWLGLFAGVAVYVFGSFINNKYVSFAGLAAGLAVLSLVTAYNSAIVLLFAFSAFYLGIPFVWLLMPIFGHPRMWDNLKYRIFGIRGNLKKVAQAEEKKETTNSNANVPVAKPEVKDDKKDKVYPGKDDVGAAVCGKTSTSRAPPVGAESAEPVSVEDETRVLVIKSMVEQGRQFGLNEATAQEAEKIVDNINGLKLNGKPVSAEDLETAEVDILMELLAGFSEGEKAALLSETNNAIKEGKFVAHFNFGGGATRLGLGAMYFVRIKELAKVMLGIESDYYSGAQADAINKKVIGYLKDRNCNAEKFTEFKDSVRGLYEGLAYAEDKGMGPAQLMMYNLQLKKFALRNNIGFAELLSRSSIIIHINDEMLKDVLTDLVKNNFYGFNSGNVYILSDTVFHGYKLGPGYEIALDKKSALLPPGHGYALEQFNIRNQVRVFEDGEWKLVEPTILDILRGKGAEYIRTQRINDLTMWTEDVLSVERLAYFIYQSRKGAQIGIELVGNFTGQKGGSFVKFKNTAHRFLVETLALKTPELKEVIERSGTDNLPYNAFRNIYRLDPLAEMLAKHKLPRYLRYKDGYFYTEMVTGDVTQLTDTNTVAFRLDEKELIHDFKEFSNITEGLKFLKLWVDTMNSGVKDGGMGSRHVFLTPAENVYKNISNGAVVAGGLSGRALFKGPEDIRRKTDLAEEGNIKCETCKGTSFEKDAVRSELVCSKCGLTIPIVVDLNENSRSRNSWDERFQYHGIKSPGVRQIRQLNAFAYENNMVAEKMHTIFGLVDASGMSLPKAVDLVVKNNGGNGNSLPAEKKEVIRSFNAFAGKIINENNGIRAKNDPGFIQSIYEYASVKGVELTKSEVMRIARAYPGKYKWIIDIMPIIKGYADSRGMVLPPSDISSLAIGYPYSYEDKINLCAEINECAKAQGILLTRKMSFYLAKTFPNKYRKILAAYPGISRYLEEEGVLLSEARVFYVASRYPNNYREFIGSLKKLQNVIRDNFGVKMTSSVCFDVVSKNKRWNDNPLEWLADNLLKPNLEVDDIRTAVAGIARLYKLDMNVKTAENLVEELSRNKKPSKFGDIKYAVRKTAKDRNGVTGHRNIFSARAENAYKTSGDGGKAIGSGRLAEKLADEGYLRKEPRIAKKQEFRFFLNGPIMLKAGINI